MPLLKQINDLLQKFANADGLSLSQAPVQTRQWLEASSRLSPDMIHILSQSWPSEDCHLGVYDLWNLGHLSEAERAKIAFNGGFFMIGSALNGDLLVIPRRPDPIDECEIGLISHEEIWEEDVILKDIYEPVCRGFLTLLNNAGLEDGFPLDFYAARERKNT